MTSYIANLLCEAYVTERSCYDKVLTIVSFRPYIHRLADVGRATYALEALGRLCRGPEGMTLITVLRQYAPSWLMHLPTLLAPVYGWFTEGFDTTDLQEAKTLLDELEG